MGDHSENWSQTMKTLFILLLALACALPLPTPEESNESSGEESDEINETGEDVQEVEVEEINEDFVIISSCVVEAMDEDGNLNEETLDKCGQCFNEAEKQEGYEAATACALEHLPNIYEDCKDLIESPDDNEADVLECFIDFVKVFDQTGEIQERVKEDLGKEGEEESEESDASEESNETSEDLQGLETNEDFVIASSCVVEALDEDGNLDEEAVEKCGQCFADADIPDLEEEYAFEAAKACTTEHLPNIYEDCRDLIESPDDNEAEVLKCIMDFVEVFDQTGEIRERVKEELGL